MEREIEKAKNLKLILSAFEQLSGLKINFHKSELFCFGEAKEAIQQYTELFGCEQGQFPMRLHAKKLNVHQDNPTNAE